jgi:hypothetical protein
LTLRRLAEFARHTDVVAVAFAGNESARRNRKGAAVVQNAIEPLLPHLRGLAMSHHAVTLGPIVRCHCQMFLQRLEKIPRTGLNDVPSKQRRSEHISARSNFAYGMIASLPLIRFGATIDNCADDHPLKMRVR